jgi:hypothetical protein
VLDDIRAVAARAVRAATVPCVLARLQEQGRGGRRCGGVGRAGERDASDEPPWAEQLAAAAERRGGGGGPDGALAGDIYAGIVQIINELCRRLTVDLVNAAVLLAISSSGGLILIHISTIHSTSASMNVQNITTQAKVFRLRIKECHVASHCSLFRLSSPLHLRSCPSLVRTLCSTSADSVRHGAMGFIYFLNTIMLKEITRFTLIMLIEKEEYTLNFVNI